MFSERCQQESICLIKYQSEIYMNCFRIVFIVFEEQYFFSYHRSFITSCPRMSHITLRTLKKVNKLYFEWTDLNYPLNSLVSFRTKKIIQGDKSSNNLEYEDIIHSNNSITVYAHKLCKRNCADDFYQNI